MKEVCRKSSLVLQGTNINHVFLIFLPKRVFLLRYLSVLRGLLHKHQHIKFSHKHQHDYVPLIVQNKLKN